MSRPAGNPIEPGTVASIDPTVLTKAIDSSGTPFCVTDKTGTIRYVNDIFCEICGYERFELIGNPISILKSGETSDDVYRDLWQTIGNGKTWHGTLSNKKKNGDVYSESIYISPIPSATGESEYFTGTWQDVTQRVAYETRLESEVEDLKNSETRLEHYVARAAHDLKNPVGQIYSISDFLAKTVAGLSNDDQHLLFGIRDVAERMNDLIGATLDLSRIREDKLNFETTDLNEVFEEARNDHDHNLEFIDAHVNIETLPTVVGDRILIYELFSNLISNSIKFREPDLSLQIRIKGTKIGKGCSIEYTDNGIGIPRDKIEKIFMPLERAHEEDGYEGLGMGLAICQKIVRQHRGSISVESEPGIGTAFIIDLP